MYQLMRREAALHEDVHVPLAELEVVLGDSLGPPWRRYALRVGESRGRFVLTPTSLRQVASLAGIPERTFHVVPAPLGVTLLRTALRLAAERDGRPRLVRLRHGRPRTVRAVLPASFVRLDGTEIVDELIRRVGEDTPVWNLHLGPDLLAFRVVLAGETVSLGDLAGSDTAVPAVDLLASETGRAPLRVRCVMIRVVCVNGLTTASEMDGGLTLRHTAAHRDRFRELVEAALDRAVPAAREAAGRLGAARTEFIEDPRGELRRLLAAHRLGALDGRVGRIVWPEVARAETLFGVSRFDFVQALTAAARGFGPETRRRLEDAAGGYVAAGRAVA